MSPALAGGFLTTAPLGKSPQLITEIGGLNHHHLLLGAALWTPCDLSLDATSFIQFLHEITEGEAREEI